MRSATGNVERGGGFWGDAGGLRRAKAKAYERIALRSRILGVSVLVDRHRQARLQHDNAVERPTAEHQALEAFGGAHPRQLVEIA